MSGDIRMSGSRTVQKKIWLNLSRAAALLTRSFVCFILSLYNALYVLETFNYSKLMTLLDIIHVVCTVRILCIEPYSVTNKEPGVYYLMFTTFTREMFSFVEGTQLILNSSFPQYLRILDRDRRSRVPWPGCRLRSSLCAWSIHR